MNADLVTAAVNVEQADVQMLPVAGAIAMPPGEGGFHLDKHNQPYAKVIATPSDPTWTIVPATRSSRC